MPQDAFLIGAGFSRAVRPSMPTLKEVGDSIRTNVLSSPKHIAMLPERVADLLQRGQIPGGNVEIWLSSLAEPQPYLSAAEASINYGLFLDISRQLVRLVDGPQQDFWIDAPPWLHRLIRLW